MNRLRAFPWMTAAWLAMGGLVTAGFASLRYDAVRRCEAGNDFRRRDLPAAFAAENQFLGRELGADQDRIDDASARFQLVLDDLFPERECSFW